MPPPPPPDSSATTDTAVLEEEVNELNSQVQSMSTTVKILSEGVDDVVVDTTATVKGNMFHGYDVVVNIASMMRAPTGIHVHCSQKFIDVMRAQKNRSALLAKREEMYNEHADLMLKDDNLTRSNIFADEPLSFMHCGAIGQFDSGKSFILAKLSGRPFTHGDTDHTLGVSTIVSDPEGGQYVVYVDPAGSRSPVRMQIERATIRALGKSQEKAEKAGVTARDIVQGADYPDYKAMLNDDEKMREFGFSDRRATEAFIEDFVVGKCEAILFFTNALKLPDQAKISDMRKKLEGSDKCLFVIHNWRHVETYKAFREHLQEHIMDPFSFDDKTIVDEDPMAQASVPEIITHADGGVPVRHFIFTRYGKDGQPDPVRVAGDRSWNQMVEVKLRKLLNTMAKSAGEVSKYTFVEDLAEAYAANFSNYITSPVLTDNEETGMCKITPAEWTIKMDDEEEGEGGDSNVELDRFAMRRIKDITFEVKLPARNELQPLADYAHTCTFYKFLKFLDIGTVIWENPRECVIAKYTSQKNKEYLIVWVKEPNNAKISLAVNPTKTQELNITCSALVKDRLTQHLEKVYEDSSTHNYIVRKSIPATRSWSFTFPDNYYLKTSRSAIQEIPATNAKEVQGTSWKKFFVKIATP